MQHAAVIIMLLASIAVLGFLVVVSYKLLRNTQAQNSSEKKSGKHYQLHPKLKQQQQRQSEDSQDK
ncbi:hypothetical protein KAM398_04470 [Acinetobacter sp. KAM398]|uniref:hypothetical protein n=1 Tax=Acinetobacter TaxID=469 RepID=UPI001F31BCCC|nr:MULTISPECIES: hypothetical protein [Acinetobacter]MDM1755607.1 hypothetical protein [Acinetobacter towneri]UIZ56819.1 hypothetical protein LZP46_10505 [Acinetobacter sp. SCLZS86]GJC30317.1 hypothetical protein KAM392_02960 [Acinetobacter sp. KAM392]GJC33126.1 hypothetical protein KAM393_02950 [Acinetobacter sp. KAM393]GJC35955.1 hypothetical protein KAM394_02950 [Acinetobacter sp. KAM394]